MSKSKFFILSTLTISMLAANASLISTDIEDRKSLNITIYNNDLALIKDERSLKSDLESNKIYDLEFKDVSGKINSKSSIFEGAEMVYEQNFNYDLLSQKSLFERHIGKEVLLKDRESNTQKEVQILNVLNNNAIVKDLIENKIFSVNINSEDYTFIFNEIPDNLRVKPTLSLKIKNLQKDISLTYLTSGLSWSADYVANLNKEANEMNISGWVTLNNTSLTSYKDVSLSLLAGDLNRVHNNNQIRVMSKSLMTEASMDVSLESKDVGDYKKYEVPFKVDIDNNQQKQVSLLNKYNVPVEKTYEYKLNVEANVLKEKAPIYISFINNKENKLGLPLPSGTIRYYEKGNDSTNFIGENKIGQTSINEEIKTNIGNAFDITLNKKVIDSKKISNNEHLVTVDYELINGSKNLKEVIINESSYGRSLEILNSNENIMMLKDSNSITKKFKIDLNKEEVKKFKIQYKIIRR